MPSISAEDRPVVIFVIFPDAKLLDVAGPMQVFTDASLYGRGMYYEIILVSVDGGEQLTDTGVKLPTQPMDQWRDRPIHTLLIAGGLGARAAAQNSELLAKTVELARHSKRVGSVCTGASVLAAAGLLEGRRAVTHWAFCQDLAAKHPTVKVEPDRIYGVRPVKVPDVVLFHPEMGCDDNTYAAKRFFRRFATVALALLARKCVGIFRSDLANL